MFQCMKEELVDAIPAHLLTIVSVSIGSGE